MNPNNTLDLFSVLCAILVATGTVLVKVAQLRLHVQRDLDKCELEREKLRVRLSAFETEMVALRRLLPGGDWYVQLGLDKHPSKEDGK